MSKSSFSSIIQNRGFRFLWINQLLMQLAVNTLNFALIIWVFKLTNSNFAVSALILSIYLPALIFGIFAGVYVDMNDRRKTILLVDFLLALLFLIFILVKDFYPLILINAFLINCLFQFFIPAENSSIPMLLSKTKLFLANSLFSFTLYGSFMIGFTLAGPILNYLGIDAIFFLGSASLFSAFLMVQKLPNLKTRASKLERGIISLIVSETRKTIQFIRGKLNVAVAIALLSSIQGIIGVLAVTISSYMERVLRIQATDASFVLMLPLGLGMVTGAIVVGKLFGNAPRRFLVIPAIILSGLLLFMVGIAPTLARWLNAIDLPEHLPRLRYFLDAPSLSSTFAIGAYLLGFCAVTIIIPSQTILQESTTVQNRGKIFAVLSVMMNAFAILPVLLAGAAADLFGETTVFVGLGIVVAMIGILALKPAVFFAEYTLPYRWREFLGLGHWEKG